MGEERARGGNTVCGGGFGLMECLKRLGSVSVKRMKLGEMRREAGFKGCPMSLLINCHCLLLTHGCNRDLEHHKISGCRYTAELREGQLFLDSEASSPSRFEPR